MHDCGRTYPNIRCASLFLIPVAWFTADFEILLALPRALFEQSGQILPYTFVSDGRTISNRFRVLKNGGTVIWSQNAHVLGEIHTGKAKKGLR